MKHRVSNVRAVVNRASIAWSSVVQAAGGLAALLSLSTLSSCASTGTFLWVDELPTNMAQTMPGLIIAPGDLINVRVFGQDTLSVRTTVRSDGMITMALIGDVAVAGKRTGVAADEIEARLKPFVTTPNVVVNIEESRIRVVAIGEIRRPGTLVLDASDAGMLTALANAGGITEFAGYSRVFVLRTEPTGTQRIRFMYDDIIHGVGRAAAFRLRNGDQVVVE